PTADPDTAPVTDLIAEANPTYRKRGVDFISEADAMAFMMTRTGATKQPYYRRFPQELNDRLGWNIGEAKAHGRRVAEQVCVAGMNTEGRIRVPDVADISRPARPFNQPTDLHY